MAGEVNSTVFIWAQDGREKSVLINVSNCPTRCDYVQFISVNCSTCFGWQLHPSSGALVTVITASGTCQTVSAIIRYGGVVGTAVPTTCQTVSATVRNGGEVGTTVPFQPLHHSG
jgi:hypothetical protein